MILFIAGIIFGIVLTLAVLLIIAVFYLAAKRNHLRWWIILGSLMLSMIPACAAPPYISPTPQPATLSWTASPDPRVTGYNTKAYPPGASAWTNALTVPATQMTAPGILTNWPAGTAFTETSTDAVDQLESNGSNIVTNQPALVAPISVIQK